jgi:hypothetical protein
MNEHLIHQISDISIHATIMVIFLTIFFFTISVKIEKHVAKEQMTKISKIYTEKYIVKEIIGGISQDDKDDMIESLKNKGDIDISETNKTIIKRGIIFVSVMTMITIILNAILYYVSKNLNIASIILTNLIAIMFIGMMEFIFIFFVGKNVDIIQSSWLNTEVYNVFIKNLK